MTMYCFSGLSDIFRRLFQYNPDCSFRYVGDYFSIIPTGHSVLSLPQPEVVFRDDALVFPGICTTVLWPAKILLARMWALLLALDSEAVTSRSPVTSLSFMGGRSHLSTLTLKPAIKPDPIRVSGSTPVSKPGSMSGSTSHTTSGSTRGST